MQIHVQNRVNKLPASEQRAGKLTIWDNATEVSWKELGELSLDDFKKLRAKTADTTTANVDYLIKVLKQPKMCPADEKYHAAEVRWTDRSTGKRYLLIFDTMVFACNDSGKTQHKITG